MLVSEPLAEKALACDEWHEPSILSTTMFSPKHRRACWKVVYWEGISGITKSTIDYLCPQCEKPIHSDHTNNRRCPRCGLMVGESPVFRDTLPVHIRHKEWKAWMNGQLEDDNAETRVPGSKAKRKTPSGSRPGKSSRSK
jgi:hypothetical protein